MYVLNISKKTKTRIMKKCTNSYKKQKPVFPKTLEDTGFISDHAKIQTWNLLSRNQVRYSVAPRGHLKWVQI